MSVVTNAILVYSLSEDEEIIEKVNTYFSDCLLNKTHLNCCGFKQCEDYGGCKGFESGLLIGAFNHLDLAALKKHLQTIQWKYPQRVQLIYQEQDRERFSVWSIKSPGA